MKKLADISAFESLGNSGTQVSCFNGFWSNHSGNDGGFRSGYKGARKQVALLKPQLKNLVAAHDKLMAACAMSEKATATARATVEKAREDVRKYAGQYVTWANKFRGMAGSFDTELSPTGETSFLFRLDTDVLSRIYQVLGPQWFEEFAYYFPPDVVQEAAGR